MAALVEKIMSQMNKVFLPGQVGHIVDVKLHFCICFSLDDNTHNNTLTALFSSPCLRWGWAILSYIFVSLKFYSKNTPGNQEKNN